MPFTSMQVVRSIPALDDLKLVILALLFGGAGIVLVRRRLMAAPSANRSLLEGRRAAPWVHKLVR